MKQRVKILLSILATLTSCAAIAVGLHLYCGGSVQESVGPMPTVNMEDTGLDFGDRSATLIAHRGLSALAPENTYAAVELAGRRRFLSVEFDVRETRDGLWVLMHDATITRMTDGKGKVHRLTYYELLEYTINNGAHIEEYPNEKIPTLEIILDLCIQYGMRPVIEIKTGSDAGLERLAVMLEERGLTEQCVVISFDRGVLDALRERLPNTPMWRLVPRLTDKAVAAAIDDKEYGIGFPANAKHSTDERIQALTESGIAVAAWNVNDAETLKHLHALGVREFITDGILPAQQ